MFSVEASNLCVIVKHRLRFLNSRKRAREAKARSKSAENCSLHPPNKLPLLIHCIINMSC